MEPFVAEHYRPEPKKKVRRNDPFRDGAFAAIVDRTCEMIADAG